LAALSGPGPREGFAIGNIAMRESQVRAIALYVSLS
jgi:hypothetical protein